MGDVHSQSADLRALESYIAARPRASSKGWGLIFAPSVTFIAAGALGNLAHRLSELGCESEALAEAELALAICRRLVKADAPAHDPQLAVLLNNLGMLSDTPEKRLAAAQEAVEIGHRLAQANPTRYEQQLLVRHHPFGRGPAEEREPKRAKLLCDKRIEPLTGLRTASADQHWPHVD